MEMSNGVRCARTAIALAALAAAGCGQQAPSLRDRSDGAVTADCVVLLRRGGETFHEVGSGAASAMGTRLGDAEQSSCDDVGRDARGAYFAKDARVVATWAVRGQHPAEVIAAAGSDGTVVLYVADDLSGRRRERLRSELGATG